MLPTLYLYNIQYCIIVCIIIIVLNNVLAHTRWRDSWCCIIIHKGIKRSIFSILKKCRTLNPFEKLILFSKRHVIIVFYCRLSECYFANKGSATVLCSPTSHHQQPQQHRRKRHHHHSHPHRHQSLSAPASSRVPADEDEMQTRANDIQAHLQSMFHILRPDDSLNMVCNIHISL